MLEPLPAGTNSFRGRFGVYEHAGPPPPHVSITIEEPSPAETQCKNTIYFFSTEKKKQEHNFLQRNKLWAILDFLFVRKPAFAK
jgi:hypothetical protein